MLTLPISPLWPLAASEESWQPRLFYFIYLESDTFIVVSCAINIRRFGVGLIKNPHQDFNVWYKTITNYAKKVPRHTFLFFLLHNNAPRSIKVNK